MTSAATRETAIGGVVVGLMLIAVVGNAVHHRVSGEGHHGFMVEAIFPQADGVGGGTEVRLSGVPVGQVVSQSLDASFRSHATLLIETKTPIPADSAVTIETDGLLGAKYIEIQAGGSDDLWHDGSMIDEGLTQGSLGIQDLLARIVGQAQARHAASASAPASGGGPGNGPQPNDHRTTTP